MIFVVLYPDGTVKRAGSAQTLPAGATRVTIGAEPQEGDLGIDHVPSIQALTRMQAVDGLLLARPAGPQPYVSGSSIVVPSCPAGTRIEVNDLAGGELMHVETGVAEGYTETFDFPDPGLYEVEVEAPAPYLPTSVRLEVTS